MKRIGSFSAGTAVTCIAMSSAQAAGSVAVPAVMGSEPTLPTHTIYRPVDLDQAGKLPVLVWGNGGCRNLGNSAQEFLTEIASHGFLIIAVGPIGERPPQVERTADMPRPADPDGVWRTETTTQAMIAAIDWAIAENARPGSAYLDEIDTAKIAVAGHS